MNEIVTSGDVPQSIGGNADPMQVEFESLKKGQLMAIDLTAEAPPSGIMGGSGLLAELKIGQQGSDPGVQLSEVKIIRVRGIEDASFKELSSWAAAHELPQSGIVMFAMASEGTISSATFLDPHTDNILGRQGTLKWNHYGAGEQKSAELSPYSDNDRISREQVRLGVFGDRLLLEGLTDNSDVDVRTVLPHGTI